MDVGANVFVGNLAPDVDDQLLYNTFSAVRQVLSAKVMYEDDGTSRGFGFVNFADFDSSDAGMFQNQIFSIFYLQFLFKILIFSAILAMNQQFLCNRSIHVSYAYRKDGEQGERHGSLA